MIFDVESRNTAHKVVAHLLHGEIVIVPGGGIWLSQAVWARSGSNMAVIISKKDTGPGVRAIVYSQWENTPAAKRT